MKQLVYILGLSLVVTSCKTKSSIVTSKEEAKSKGIYSYTNATSKKDKVSVTTSASSPKSYTAKKTGIAYEIVDKAMDYKGVRYRTGGTTKSGMDCSGLVYTTFKSFDINVPRTSGSLALQGKKVSKSKALPGDLIFFKTNGKRSINHVGIITEINGNEIKFIHASTSSGVIVSSTAERYYANTFAQINRLIE
ncbi:C40 family peptidase [Flavobacterium sp. NRK F10]|nr:C40 family peptidase [Flavobacterium sp. NRK F10]MCO6174501.1 C40 family peptidase [Flavobacterium sp. NRK F10]